MNEEHTADNVAPLTTAEREALYPVVRKSVGAYMVIERVLRERTERLRGEVIAVIAEHFWDGDTDNGQPDYDTISRLWDDAASNVIPPGDGDGCTCGRLPHAPECRRPRA